MTENCEGIACINKSSDKIYLCSDCLNMLEKILYNEFINKQNQKESLISKLISKIKRNNKKS